MGFSLTRFFNIEVRSPGVKPAYNENIEAYRGVCAMLVMITHGIVHTDMIADHFKWPELMEYLGAGYLSVIIFFCISGYVIGLNYSNKKLDIGEYAINRLLRLYPVYMISILLCLLVVGRFTVYTLLENFLFLQNNVPYGNYQVPVLVNYVTWSLNYEIIYYIAFIGLFLLRPKAWKLLLFLFIVSVLTIGVSSNWQFAVNYLNGFYFWLLGLLIAWGVFNNDTADHPHFPGIPIFSLIFLHLCQHYLGLGEIILHLAGIYTKGNINWLFDLPFCLLVISTLTHKHSAFLRFNKIMCYTIPSFVFMFLIFHHRLFENDRWIMCASYWLLSLVFYFERSFSAFWIPKFAWIGKISYAVYLFHVPLGCLIKKTIIITNQPLEIAVKYLLWIVLTFTLSYLAELKLQPEIKRYFKLNEKNKPLLSEKA